MASLKKKSRRTYSGPSIICGNQGKITPQDQFKVTGSVSSRFGKPWYKIQFTSSRHSAWIPSKYVSLEGKVRIVEKSLTEKQSSPISDLNTEGLSGLQPEPVHTEPKETGAFKPQYSQVNATQSFDPCAQKKKVTYYKDHRIWHLKDNIVLTKAPHHQCSKTYELSQGKALISSGETDKYYAILFVEGDNLVSGYLKKSLYANQYVPMEPLPFKLDEARSDLLKDLLIERSAYWNSYSYLLLRIWKSIPGWYERYQTLIFSLIGIVLLIVRRTRRIIWLTSEAIAKALLLGLQDLFEWLKSQRASLPFSNWNTMIQGLHYSPQAFFQQVEHAIREKQIDHLRVSRVRMPEGGIFSPRREYLRVTRKSLCFDICGAPYGNGFFVSWWLGEIPSGALAILYRIPLLSWFAWGYERLLHTETYFTHDTRKMYQSLTHDAVMSVVDHITTENGMRSLTPEEKKPVMKGFFDA